MTFEEFLNRNMDRYLKIAKSTETLHGFDIKLALQTAAKEAWEVGQANTVVKKLNYANASTRGIRMKRTHPKDPYWIDNKIPE
jgi:hypothetical protein